MSDDDPHEGEVVFQVETLTHGSINLGYSPEDADELAGDLDRSTTILACRSGCVLTPVSDGIPPSMPPCPACNLPLVGVTEVTVVSDPRSDDEHATTSEDRADE